MIETSTHGIFQGDVIIRTAILAGIEDLRKNPWLLDFAFASLVHDDLTRAAYGEKTVNEAKNWFKNTNLDVLLSYKVNKIDNPTIAISLEDSGEDAKQLGNVNLEGETEEVDMKEVYHTSGKVLGPFTPQYDYLTGIVTFPSNVSTLYVFKNMYLHDVLNKVAYTITEVIDSNTVRIATGLKPNFTNAIVSSSSDKRVVMLESICERETYRLQLFVQGDYEALLNLFTIIKFVLFRYNQDLFEARGFERMTLSATPLRLMGGPSQAETTYIRSIMVTGYVRQYWPAQITGRIDGVMGDTVDGVMGDTVDGFIKVKDGPESPDSIKQKVAEQGWEMEEDSLGGYR